MFPEETEMPTRHLSVGSAFHFCKSAVDFLVDFYILLKFGETRLECYHLMGLYVLSMQFSLLHDV